MVKKRGNTYSNININKKVQNITDLKVSNTTEIFVYHYNSRRET